MKLWSVYKKQFNFLIVGLFIFLPIFFSVAETINELNLKINQNNNDISNIEVEIKQFQSQLDSLGKQKNSLNNLIKELDLTKKKLNADILLTQKKIDKTNLKINTLSSQIIDKQSSITNGVNAIELLVKRTYESDQISLIESLLSGDNFSIVWNDIDNMISIRENIIKKNKELKEIKSELEDTRVETLDAKKELLFLKSKLADQKKIVEQNAIEKKKLLAETKNNESNYQKLLKQRLAKKEALEKEILEYESKIKYILDPSKLPDAHVLDWPLDYVYITQLFGVTKDSKRLYASGSHSGVDFRASVGTPVKAVADGIVLGIGDTDLTCYGASFGKFVFLKHYNGLSTAYGHLSLIKVRQGQNVNKGDVIAYSGNTGHTTGPHLHLTVYAADAAKIDTVPSKACEGRSYTMPIAPRNAYLDPMYYLPTYKQ